MRQQVGQAQVSEKDLADQRAELQKVQLEAEQQKVVA